MEHGIWYTWDNDDNEIEVDVVILEEFYEPGDPIPGYNLKVKEDSGPYVKNQLVGGIDSQNVIIVGKELHDGHFV